MKKLLKVILILVIILSISLILFLKNKTTIYEGNSFLYSCLPKNVSLSDIASNENGVTIEQKLSEIGAYCIDDKLLDSNQKEVVFYFLKGCWGNPPIDYIEILQKQNEEINELKKEFNVVEIGCNTSGELPV